VDEDEDEDGSSGRCPRSPNRWRSVLTWPRLKTRIGSVSPGMRTTPASGKTGSSTRAPMGRKVRPLTLSVAPKYECACARAGLKETSGDGVGVMVEEGGGELPAAVRMRDMACWSMANAA
jgi:hypothetical protein